ncbi:Thioredoxin H4 [Orchesella cincta]|uniref:Thioredoxin H4 n=1 Tax=Orchesella cincta TaxID=48709 RepID=A0A1D2MT47_ORCCI|nr:Thioredoxin H4 [Orchesella cincta]
MDFKTFLVLLGMAVAVTKAAPNSDHRVPTVRTEDELIRGLEGALSNGRTAVIRFYADWCPVCQADVHEFNKLIDKYPESSTKFFRIDVDQHPQLVSEYGIKAVPTYFVLRRNTAHSTFHGAQDVDNFLQRV